jgi:hypothetical protein
MKSSPQEKPESESLKKALRERKPFDEAEYYQSRQVEMGGEDVLKEDPEEEDDEDYEDHEYYGDDD